MGTASVILGALFLGFVVVVSYVFVIYNGLIALKENIQKAWGNIDVILKQRHDEIPKLISVCEGSAQFEASVLKRLMEARENYTRARTVAQKAEASGQISAGFSGIFGIAENYPDLKTNKNFLNLQERISHLEESLSDRREFYNDSANNYNIRIQQIPDVVIAGFMGLKKEEMFKANEAERRDVEVKFNFPKM